jgi:hypothetical protein
MAASLVAGIVAQKKANSGFSFPLLSLTQHTNPKNFDLEIEVVKQLHD